MEERATSFFLLDPRSELPDGRLTRRALLVAGAYRLHYLARHGQGQPSTTDPEYLRRALDQSIKEAAIGHTRAMKVLDSTWRS